MRSLVLGTVIAASLLSGGCYVATRERPVARYHHHGYVRGEPPPPRVYVERRHYYGDDRGYRHRHDPYWR
jgi:hypothetical protein